MGKVKIIVVDVPAEVGGALSILKNFYAEIDSEDQNEWIFMISTPDMKNKSNVIIRKYPWVKKNWFFRLFFDYIVCPITIYRENPDVIFSLQNVTVPFSKKKQILYVHQPLPFISYQYSLKENKLFWIYQNIIAKKIYRSIKKSYKVIVQTEWMKRSILKKTRVNATQIIKSSPKIRADQIDHFNSESANFNTFFFPASSIPYKNHEIILEAVDLLVKNGVTSFEVIFTLTGEEDSYARHLYEFSRKKELPIKFVGYLPQFELEKYYKKNVMIFPSNIETFGMPLLEARVHNTPIICIEEYFSREILKNYNNVTYYVWDDSEKLAEIMKDYIDKKIEHSDVNNSSQLEIDANKTLYDDVIDIINFEKGK